MNMQDLVDKVKAQRGSDCIDARGNCHRTQEKARFVDDVVDHIDRGSPVEERAGLEARKAAIKAGGKW